MSSRTPERRRIGWSDLPCPTVRACCSRSAVPTSGHSRGSAGSSSSRAASRHRRTISPHGWTGFSSNEVLSRLLRNGACWWKTKSSALSPRTVAVDLVFPRSRPPGCHDRAPATTGRPARAYRRRSRRLGRGSVGLDRFWSLRKPSSPALFSTREHGPRHRARCREMSPRRGPGRPAKGRCA
jgi:hypothetical protein